VGFNIARLKRIARRVAHGPVDNIKSLADKQWVICPGESSRVPKAIHLESMIERIRGLSRWRNWEVERRMIDGDVIDHAPCIAHVLNDVDLVGAFLYKGAAVAQPGFGVDAWWSNEPAVREVLDEAELVSSNGASFYFGCWLLDEVPLSALLSGNPNTIRMQSQGYLHEAGYRQLLGQPAPRLVKRARVRHLTLFSDFGQNRSREQRYRQLRERLRRALGSSGEPPSGVYLKRGRGGEPRVLGNEAEVEALMERLGFRVIEPTSLSADEIARLTLDATVVVSVEGSHLSHVIYSMADDATLLVIQPPHRFSLAYTEYTDRMSMRFAFVVGQPHPDGFIADPGDIARTIDLAVYERRVAG
jgi:hypothetical protein